MAKIFKGAASTASNVSDYGRECLEDFPDAPVQALELPGEEPEELDPEAIRAAIMEEARAEAELKVREAYEEGLKRGTDAGRQAFEESIAQCAAALESAAAAMQETRRAFLDSLEPQVLALSKLVAERVLQREVRTDDALIVDTVHRALVKIADRQALRVRVNPNDRAALEEHQVALLESFPAGVSFVVEADENVDPGDCIVDSDVACVEARMEDLLADVLDALSA